MSEYLPFWPKAGIGAYVTNGGGTAVVYSKALPTNGFTEVVIQMEIDATFGAAAGPPNTTVDVAPEISNDGVNWKTLTASSLSIANNATFPAQATEKFTEIGAFMRMKITITSREAASGMIVAPLLVSAAGRS
jgi:hypothetical protein